MLFRLLAMSALVSKTVLAGGYPPPPRPEVQHYVVPGASSYPITGIQVRYSQSNVAVDVFCQSGCPTPAPEYRTVVQRDLDDHLASDYQIAQQQLPQLNAQAGHTLWISLMNKKGAESEMVTGRIEIYYGKGLDRTIVFMVRPPGYDIGSDYDVVYAKPPELFDFQTPDFGTLNSVPEVDGSTAPAGGGGGEEQEPQSSWLFRPFFVPLLDRLFPSAHALVAGPVCEMDEKDAPPLAPFKLLFCDSNPADGVEDEGCRPNYAKRVPNAHTGSGRQMLEQFCFSTPDFSDGNPSCGQACAKPPSWERRGEGDPDVESHFEAHYFAKFERSCDAQEPDGFDVYGVKEVKLRWSPASDHVLSPITEAEIAYWQGFSGKEDVDTRNKVYHHLLQNNRVNRDLAVRRVYALDLALRDTLFHEELHETDILGGWTAYEEVVNRAGEAVPGEIQVQEGGDPDEVVQTCIDSVIAKARMNDRYVACSDALHARELRNLSTNSLDVSRVVAAKKCACTGNSLYCKQLIDVKGGGKPTENFARTDMECDYSEEVAAALEACQI